MPDDYSVVEQLDVAVTIHSGPVVMLRVTLTRPGLSAPLMHGNLFAGDDRLERACDAAGRLLCGWAAVGELAVFQLVDGWPQLAT